MDQPSSPSSPSPVIAAAGSNAKDRTRLQIIASFWIVIILSLPVWWNTTKIERRALPTAEVESWNHLQPCPIRFPIKLTSSEPDITSYAMKAQVDSLETILESGRDTYQDTIDILAARCFDFHVESTTTSASGLGVILHRSHSDVQNHKGNFAYEKDISISLKSNNKAQELLQHIAPLPSSSSSTQARDSRVIKYSSQLKLVFSLMNEDCTQPSFVRSWSIKHAIELYLEDLLASLAPLHNLTCHTQILQHSPLAFEPTVISNGGQPTYLVEEEELKAFINDADWNLASSVTMEPVINFVLWVPSHAHRPFKIRRTDGTLDVDGSFIRPQWGSVVIYNPEDDALAGSIEPRLGVAELARPMKIFRHHLLSLLGIADALDTPELRTLALDAIVRRRIVENSLEAINSIQVIVNLITDQTNMRVSKQVQNQVKGSLASLKHAQEELLKADGSLWKAAVHADESKTLSSMAFFSPTMLSLLYFPDEHKYAIYTPLFGPVLVPLIIALIKELKSRRKKKSEKEKEE